jgi:hypothetical protein
MPDPSEVVVIVPDDTANPADALSSTDSEPVVVEVFDAILDPFGSNDPTDSTAFATSDGEPEIVVIETGGVSDIADGTATASTVDTDTGSTFDPTDLAAGAGLGAVAASPGDTDTGGGFDPTDLAAGAGLGAATASAVDTDTGGAFDPTAVASDIDGGTTPDVGEATDPTVTDTDTAAATDPDLTAAADSGATAAADPDAAAADPDATGDTTDADTQAQTDAVNDATATQQQAEQSEAQAVASGDYATASDDAQQAYSASQDVANAGGADNTDSTWTAAQNESWANWDQQTADQDQATAESYANSATPDDASIYSAAAENEQGNADNAAEAGEYGDPLGPEADSTAAPEEAPVDDTPVDDSAPAEDAAPVEDTSTVDDDSSAT